MATGIYCIRNLITGDFYIGSASRSIKDRWGQHRSSLNTGKHRNCRLQADWKFYGSVSFQFSVLEECEPDRCIEREQHYLDVFYPQYNIARIAEASFKGRKHSLESRAKMSKALKGRTVSPEARRNIGLASLGRVFSREARAKISASLLGNQHTLGYSPTPETRARLSAAGMGNKNSLGHHHTPEEKAKARSYRHTVEARSRMSIVSKGRPKSPEHRASMRAAWVLRKARKINPTTASTTNPL